MKKTSSPITVYTIVIILNIIYVLLVGKKFPKQFTVENYWLFLPKRAHNLNMSKNKSRNRNHKKKHH